MDLEGNRIIGNPELNSVAITSALRGRFSLSLFTVPFVFFVLSVKL